jgi:hypothetical protein
VIPFKVKRAARAAPPIGVAKNYSNAGHIIRMDAYLSLVKDAQNDR